MSLKTIRKCDKCYEVIENKDRYGEITLRALNKGNLVDVNCLDLCSKCLREFVLWMPRKTR